MPSWAALAALLILPFAAAQPTSPAGPGPAGGEPAGTDCFAVGPPCGYITPLVDLDFPDKPRCPGAPGQADPAKCIPLPADGESLRFAGTVRWYWKESEDLTYPADPNQPIVITFGGIPTNPSWITVAVEPDAYTLTGADLADPRNLKPDTSGASPVVWFWFERPVNVTFTRHGGPSEAETERFTDRLGVQPVYVKVKSTGSGGFFKESFGGEEFRFNATALLPAAAPPAQASPGPAAVPVAAAVLLFGARRRREGR